MRSKTELDSRLPRDNRLGHQIVSHLQISLPFSGKFTLVVQKTLFLQCPLCVKPNVNQRNIEQQHAESEENRAERTARERAER